MYIMNKSQYKLCVCVCVCVCRFSGLTMGKSAAEDKIGSVASNDGLVNLSSSSMATMDLGEIPLVVLLSVIGLGLLVYKCKKRQQHQLQELRATTVQTTPSAPTQSLREKCM